MTVPRESPPKPCVPPGDQQWGSVPAVYAPVMRRAILMIVIIAASTALAAPAEAKTKPPTARQLVTKLIAAKVCTGPPIAVDPSETISKCQFIEVHAFTTKARALKALDAKLAADCISFPYGAKLYRVGPTWWMNTYTEPNLSRIGKALGGTVKTYECP